jgi:hypothetical protein
MKKGRRRRPHRAWRSAGGRRAPNDAPENCHRGGCGGVKARQLPGSKALCGFVTLTNDRRSETGGPARLKPRRCTNAILRRRRSTVPSKEWKAECLNPLPSSTSFSSRSARARGRPEVSALAALDSWKATSLSAVRWRGIARLFKTFLSLLAVQMSETRSCLTKMLVSAAVKKPTLNRMV